MDLEVKLIAERKISLMNDINNINFKLKDCINNFIYIGFILKRIKLNQNYEVLGYNSLDEFTKNEFSLSSTSVKNYIDVANKFGDDDSMQLKEEYEDYSFTQLVELLPVSDDIDSYSPEMSIKEIRSKKMISQLTDYKKVLYDFTRKYIDYFIKNNNLDFKLKVDYNSSSIYISRKNSWSNILSIYFRDGYYQFSSENFYNLDLDSYKLIFKEKFDETIKIFQKDYDDELSLKEKDKKRIIAARPENEKGISIQEKQKRIKERLDEEQINQVYKKIKKNQNFEFFDSLPHFCKTDLLCFDLFKKCNKALLSCYKLIYAPRVYNSHDTYFIGFINGLNHLRVYDLYIEKYDYTNKKWFKVFDLSHDILHIKYQYRGVFGRLFDDQVVCFIKPYLSDFNNVYNRLNDKDNNEFSLILENKDDGGN